MDSAQDVVFTGAYGVGLTAEEISRTVAQAKAEQKPVALYRRDLAILTAFADGTTLPALPAALRASLQWHRPTPAELGEEWESEALSQGVGPVRLSLRQLIKAVETAPTRVFSGRTEILAEAWSMLFLDECGDREQNPTESDVLRGRFIAEASRTPAKLQRVAKTLQEVRGGTSLPMPLVLVDDYEEGEQDAPVLDNLGGNTRLAAAVLFDIPIEVVLLTKQALLLARASESSERERLVRASPELMASQRRSGLSMQDYLIQYAEMIDELAGPAAPARAFAPKGDRCNCESEGHGHGYPCDGHAAAGKNKIMDLGEVCDACYAATPAKYKQVVVAIIDDLAADAQQRHPRLTKVRAVLAELLTDQLRTVGWSSVSGAELDAVRYLSRKALAYFERGAYHLFPLGREVALVLASQSTEIRSYSTARRGR